MPGYGFVYFVHIFAPYKKIPRQIAANKLLFRVLSTVHKDFLSTDGIPRHSFKRSCAGFFITMKCPSPGISCSIIFH